MANPITLEFPDISHITKAIRDLPGELAQKVLQGAVRKETTAWRDRARDLAPVAAEEHFVGRGKKRKKVQPGNLRRSMRVAKLRTEKLASQFEARYGIRISRRAYYWAFLELGTAKLPARPYLRPTFDELAPESFRAVANECARAIESHFKRRLATRRTIARV